MMSKKEIISKVASVPYWGQSVRLPYGIVTPGRCMKNLETWPLLHLPDNLQGKRILDVGTMDGVYAYECEKRGAEVVAIDNLNRMQRPDEIALSVQWNLAFETAKEILDSKVKFLNIDAHDLNPFIIGKFDIVLYLGILYHLENPIKALKAAASVCRGEIIIETECLWKYFNMPVLQYCQGRYNSDPTNWFIPNKTALFSMLLDAGFKGLQLLYGGRLIIKLGRQHYRIIVKALK